MCLAAHGRKSADGLPDSSNCYCLPGRAGGSPADASRPLIIFCPPEQRTKTVRKIELERVRDWDARQPRARRRVKIDISRRRRVAALFHTPTALQGVDGQSSPVASGLVLSRSPPIAVSIRRHLPTAVQYASGSQNAPHRRSLEYLTWVIFPRSDTSRGTRMLPCNPTQSLTCGHGQEVPEAEVRSTRQG